MGKSGESCLETQYRVKVKVPIGWVTVVSCKQGLHSLELRRESWCAAELERAEEGEKAGEEASDWVRGYFAGECDTSSAWLRTLVCGSVVGGWSEFEARVWRELSETERGERVSYGELATRCDRVGAARAVGSAMRRNPLPLLIPCHRVVRSSGELGNYSAEGGTQVKAWLLQFESSK